MNLSLNLRKLLTAVGLGTLIALVFSVLAWYMGGLRREIGMIVLILVVAPALGAALFAWLRHP
jgi:hypothetical protein